MITMTMIGKVKRMCFREKRSVREIVRLTSLSRNTARACLWGLPRSTRGRFGWQCNKRGHEEPVGRLEVRRYPAKA